MGARSPAASLFYRAHLSVSELVAKRVARFMSLAHQQLACQEPNPWVKGRKSRVYFAPFSQNKMPAIAWIDKAFYDAIDNEVYFTRCIMGRRRLTQSLSVIVTLDREMYSGAKTRRWLQEFAEAFYGEKADWD